MEARGRESERERERGKESERERERKREVEKGDVLIISFFFVSLRNNFFLFTLKKKGNPSRKKNLNSSP